MIPRVVHGARALAEAEARDITKQLRTTFMGPLNRIDSVSFEECWAHRFETVVSPDIPAICIWLAELIRNKAACGRAKDLDDPRNLRRVGA